MQKWSKGKVKDKAVNLVLFDEEVYAKLYKEVPKFKLITTSIMSDRLKINGSLARHAIKELMAVAKKDSLEPKRLRLLQHRG